MAALNITRENFQQEIMESDRPVLVDFWADWCGPCKMLLPTIEELAGEVTTAKICKVNVDEQQALAMEYKIASIPTLLLFKNGKLEKTSVGFMPKNAIIESLGL